MGCLVGAAPAQGPLGGDMPSFLGEGAGKREPFSADFRFLPAQGVPGQNSTLSLSQQQIRGAFPLGKWGKTLFFGKASLAHWGLDSQAVLPRGAPLPGELWAINLGVAAIHPCDNGWTVLASVSGGSASDQPFQSADELNANLLGLVNIPWGERDSWSLGAFYSPLGQVPFPIPIVNYRWVPNDQWMFNFGLPLSVQYQPTPEWSFEASYMILTQVRTRVNWQFDPSIRVYGGWEWVNQGFHLAGRPFEERFFYDEKRLVFGMQVVAQQGFVLDVSSGYAWDRVFREGEGMGGARGDRLSVNGGPFVAARLALRF
jgi:hypothetical protein